MSAPAIPVQNVYYLLLYAWGHLDEGRVVDVDALEHDRAADLLARILVSGTQHVLRRGLDRDYVEHTEVTAQLRGRVDFAGSAVLLPQAWAVCTFDELTPDVLTNRILRTTLAKLSRVADLDADLRRGLREVHGQMGGVGEVHISRALFGRVRVHGNNAFYRFLMSACALVHENLLPEEAGSGYRLSDFVRDEKQMRRLFEAFVLGFYRREWPDLDARAEPMVWDAEPLSVSGPGRLPGMLTDVTLRDDGWTCVVDTKYYRKALSRWHTDGTFSSSNLYQMTSYLRTLEANGGADAHADGVLLYPVVDGAFDHVYRTAGHRVRLVTLDLLRPWDQIHEALDEIVLWSVARV